MELTKAFRDPGSLEQSLRALGLSETAVQRALQEGAWLYIGKRLEGPEGA